MTTAIHTSQVIARSQLLSAESEAELRQLITEHSALPWSGILPKESVAEFYAPRWLKTGVELFIEADWHEKHLGAMVLQDLPWDSGLLGMPCARLYALSQPRNHGAASHDAALIGEVKATLRSKRIELADLKVSSQDLFLVRSLEDSGFHVVDMLLTLGVSATKLPQIASRFASRLKHSDGDVILADDSVIVRPIEERDQATMRHLARVAFSDTDAIQDRFFMEPHIAHEKAQNLFEEWFVNTVRTQERGEGVVLVAESEGKPVGFLTMAAPQTEAIQGYWQDGLNAISTEARGAGIYRALVMAAMHYAAVRGGGILTRTQVSTSRVISSWLHMGAELYESFFTLHYTP